MVSHHWRPCTERGLHWDTIYGDDGEVPIVHITDAIVGYGLMLLLRAQVATRSTEEPSTRSILNKFEDFVVPFCFWFFGKALNISKINRG